MRVVLVLMALISTTAFGQVSFELDVMNSSTTKIFNSKDHPQGVFAIEAYFLNCPYCNYNAANVDELSTHYKDNENVHVLDVGYDCRAAQYQGWISKHNPNHLVLNDCGGAKLLQRLGVRSYPTFIVIDCNGKEVYRTTGMWNSARKTEIHKAIDGAVAACQN